MIIVRSREELQNWRRGQGDDVGFVPTMGAIHEGHLSLVKRSVSENRFTVASIYVNPTQFNNASDLANYPDTLNEDLGQFRAEGVDVVFLPDYELLYPDGFRYRIEENDLSGELCGEHRPGHFTGVMTVVMKLLNLVGPTRAYFGEKDFQQLSLIRGMADAFFLSTEIVGCPTVREEDGLAMSSRNINLGETDRRAAPRFSRILEEAVSDEDAQKQLGEAGFQVDYVITIDERRYGAVVMGTAEKPVRLIDNVRTRIDYAAVS